MKTTWFTVATGSEQFVKMACLLSKNWHKHNKSELVIVTDSDIPEKMGLPNLKSTKWQNRRDWGWHFKFEAYDKIWEYNKSDIFCLLDSDVMPVKSVNEDYIKALSFSGCHIAMEEDMIGDGVKEWWSFKNPHLTNYMISQIRKNHPKASQAWHGNGGFHFWHRDLLKKKRFITRANQIFSDLAELSKKTGSGFPCEEPVQQTMVQELTSPKRIHEHSLEKGLTKHIQETVFWSDVPTAPSVMNKTSYFTGKRKWSCEPSNIHLISAKNKLTELSSFIIDEYEKCAKSNEIMHINLDTVKEVYEWCCQNVSGDSLLSKKLKIVISKDHRCKMSIDKNIFKKCFDKVHLENMDFKNSIEEKSSIKTKSAPVVMVFIHNGDEVNLGITKNLKLIKNGGVLIVCIKNCRDDSLIIKNTIGQPHHEIDGKLMFYMIDPIRRHKKIN